MTNLDTFLISRDVWRNWNGLLGVLSNGSICPNIPDGSDKVSFEESNTLHSFETGGILFVQNQKKNISAPPKLALSKNCPQSGKSLKKKPKSGCHPTTKTDKTAYDPTLPPELHATQLLRQHSLDMSAQELETLVVSTLGTIYPFLTPHDTHTLFMQACNHFKTKKEDNQSLADLDTVKRFSSPQLKRSIKSSKIYDSNILSANPIIPLLHKSNGIELYRVIDPNYKFFVSPGNNDLLIRKLLKLKPN